MFSWGLGEDGRLGHGDQVDQLVPKQIQALVPLKVVQVVCGGHHTAVLAGLSSPFV